MEKVDLEAVAVRTRRAYYEDGILDLVGGLLQLLIGLLLGASSAVVIVVVLGIPASQKLMEALRRRYVYPRTGYARFPKDQQSRQALWPLLFVPLTMLILVLLGDRIGNPYRWLPAFVGMLFAGALLYCAAQSRLTRYYALAAWSALVGLLFSLPSYPGRLDGIRQVLWWAGGALAISGAINLARFVRRRPLLVEEEEDDAA
jgi:hypothetical protein